MSLTLWFQSAPGLLAGRYSKSSQNWASHDLVSIRSRLISREIRRASSSALCPRWFQSAPGLLAGRYLPASQILAKPLQFQSAPGLLAGRYMLPRSVE